MTTKTPKLTKAYAGWTSKDTQKDKLGNYGGDGGKKQFQNKGGGYQKGRGNGGDRQTQTHTGGRGRGTTRTPNSKTSDQEKESRTCHWCLKPGHLIKDCRSKKANKPRAVASDKKTDKAKNAYTTRTEADVPPHKKKKPNDSNEGDSENDDMLHMYCTTIMSEKTTNPRAEPKTLGSYSATMPDRMIVDSGSEAHCWPKASKLMSNVKTSTKKMVFGNDQTLPITHMGDLGKLKDCAIVPGMTKGLLSIAQLVAVNKCAYVYTEKGVYVMKPGTKLEIKKDDVVLQGERIDGLYQVKTTDVIKAFAKSS
jgi:hypothetical protein